jgi:uncharacterized protein YndB with AHSA1/START domain
MPGRAQRGFSAPPEVVFNTATDPDRIARWLPGALRTCGVLRPEVTPGALRASWDGTTRAGWRARLEVEPGPAGGARARVELEVTSGNRVDDDLAAEFLDRLASQVAENLTAG